MGAMFARQRIARQLGCKATLDSGSSLTGANAALFVRNWGLGFEVWGLGFGVGGFTV